MICCGLSESMVDRLSVTVQVTNGGMLAWSLEDHSSTRCEGKSSREAELVTVAALRYFTLSVFQETRTHKSYLISFLATTSSC